MDGTQPLHPNLARIAAEYDRVMYRFSVRQIDAATARAQLAVLQARDDEGTVWMLDPDTGEWKYQSRAGKWVAAEPPRSGVATLTAHDLSRDPTKFNPDSKIRFDEAVVERQGLKGSVKGQVVADTARGGSRWRRLVLVVLLLLMVAAGVSMLQGGGDSPAAEVPGGGTQDVQDMPAGG